MRSSSLSAARTLSFCMASLLSLSLLASFATSISAARRSTSLFLPSSCTLSLFVSASRVYAALLYRSDSSLSAVIVVLYLLMLLSMSLSVSTTWFLRTSVSWLILSRSRTSASSVALSSAMRPLMVALLVACSWPNLVWPSATSLRLPSSASSWLLTMSLSFSSSFLSVPISLVPFSFRSTFRICTSLRFSCNFPSSSSSSTAFPRNLLTSSCALARSSSRCRSCLSASLARLSASLFPSLKLRLSPPTRASSILLASSSSPFFLASCAAISAEPLNLSISRRFSANSFM
mmetsp:Transcript_26555/g.50295  ORF Transcript_26555/g.50295 Transcript_26555/m.50295 type:complete len:290 (-) Transcript_26555:1043-1912(-)